MRKGIIFFLSFFLFAHVAFADQATSSSMLSPTPTPTQSVDYTLPYPGLLPDSPLYIFRTLRDRIIGLLIVDPIKKIDFDLLQADKRLNAATFLYNEQNGKEQLAITTIGKAENYFSESIDQTQAAAKQGIRVNDELAKLSLAARKHKEVIQDLEKQTPKALKQGMQAQEQRVEGFEERVSELQKKYK